MRNPLKFSAFLLLMAVSACSDEAAAPKGQPGFDPNAAVEVGVVTLQSQSVARFTELPGRAVAEATAEIRPQVDGIVRERLFREGGPVKAGDILYTLNDEKFQATYAAAEAALQKTEASLQGANDTLSRNEALARSNAVSTQVVQDARTAQLQAVADVAAAKAALETARINRDDATIKAPISGIIGKSTVSVGALVTANQTDALATIRQVDPILVDLVDSSANLLRIRDLVKSGKLGRIDNSPPKVTFTLENGEEYDRQGEVSLADMVVSETTGTFSLRATVANPDRIIMPGMFLRSSVNLGLMPGVFLVPQRAVSRDASGEAMAYFVGKDGKAEQRVVVTDGVAGNDWIVTKDVVEGDRLIVDGLQKIQVGTTVKPLEVEIDADGVIKQSLPAAAGNGEAAK
jgi:membrane fusion protein (multidrug efflux system)